MKVILSNENELTPIVVTGAHRTVQGANRDTLTFVFPASEGMTELDTLFTAENCESIKLVEDSGNEYVHSGYTIRAELSKKSVEVTAATEESEAVYEDRITVSMAQRTYAETQLASLTDTVDILVMESLMTE